VPVSIAGRRRQRFFYVGMAVAIAATVFAGFAKTYYLRLHYEAPPLSLLLHLHGLVFTAWVILLLAQTTLVAVNRIPVHRRLGVVGAVLAVLVLVVGTTTAIVRAKQGAAPPGGPPPLVFLAIPLGDMVVFAGLAGAGLYFRHRADIHKRLMTLATISLLAAPIARLPVPFLGAGPLTFFGLADLFLIACALHDLTTSRRVHRATVWGALVIVVSQPLRMVVAGTGPWLALATWMTQ